MKKLYLILFLVSLVYGLAGCGDNTDFSSEHVLTPDEIKEIARQDSIKEVQKNSINADLILNYAVDITMSKTLYDGVKLPVEMDKIAELFGISVENLLLGIAGESGAPEIKGFGIQGSTHADAGTITNTNAPWGHWWDAKGDISVWGAEAMVFAEFDTETSNFAIGQYPGHLVDGQVVKIIECLKYNEKRVAVVVTITAKAAGQITAPVVNTQELSISITTRADETQDPLKFDLARTFSDLGITSMDQVKYLGVNEDGSYAQEPATGTGFWYDMNGFVGVRNNNASVFTTYDDADNEFEADCIGVGQMPDKLKGGDVITIKYAFLANNKIEMLKITVHVMAYQDPETAPAGTPEAVEKTIACTKAVSTDYASIEVDIKEVLRQTFKMTTYQIHKAIVAGDLKVYLNELTAAKPTYTATAPGYWISSAGTACPWAEGVVWCSIGHNYTDLYLYSGNHPDNALAGDVVATKMIVTCNGGTATFNITFTLTPALPAAE